MSCEPRMFLLADYVAVRMVFGIFLILISICATASNILVLAIIKLPGNFTKSNRILASLAVSDLLVGVCLAPLSSAQVLSTVTLANCTLDDVRVFLTLFLTGTSVMTLAIVALDRYIILTKINKSKSRIAGRKLIILLSIAWLLPIFGACVRFIGRYPYLAMVMFILIGPLIILVIVYIMITIAVRGQEKKLLEYQSNVSTSTPQLRHNIKGSQNKQEEKKMRKKRSDIKLAKVVTILILCYLICVVPLSIWAMVGMINIDNDFVSPRTWQFLYITSIGLALFNSCLNPAIYFLKTPTFRKGLKKLFKRKKGDYTDNSSESAFKAYSSSKV